MSSAEGLQLDVALPVFDATRIETRVIEAVPAVVYAAALQVDLVDTVRRDRLVRGVFALRAAGERAVSALRGTTPQSPAPAMRLGDLGERGDWVRLADDPPHEFVFGAIGRFWGGETSWQHLDASDFGAFERPGFAKIAAAITVRPYGARRSLIAYEARTRATDDAARRAFLRYWRFVSPGVGLVLRAVLASIDDESG